jgi:hypothetical protein
MQRQSITLSRVWWWAQNWAQSRRGLPDVSGHRARREGYDTSHDTKFHAGDAGAGAGPRVVRQRGGLVAADAFPLLRTPCKFYLFFSVSLSSWIAYQLRAATFLRHWQFPPDEIVQFSPGSHYRHFHNCFHAWTRVWIWSSIRGSAGNPSGTWSASQREQV